MSRQTLRADPNSCVSNTLKDSVATPTVKQLGASKNLYQLMRSNALHYWGWAKKTAPSGVGAYLKHEGWVSGDPHPGNFAIIQVEGKLKLLPVDLDDAGRGPLVLDITKLLGMLKVFNPELKAKQVTQSYLDGLAGKRIAFPEKYREFRDMTKTDYEAIVAEYVGKKQKNGKFKLKEGEIEAATRTQKDKVKTLVSKAIPGAKIQDVAIRPVERGGSAGSLRFWILIEEKGKQRILELKTIQDSGLNAYVPQGEKGKHFQEAFDFFWEGKTDPHFQVVSLDGKPFFLREKKVDLYDSQELNKEMSYYLAYTLGRLHGRQPGGKALLAQAARSETSQETFQDAVKALAKSYLKEIESVYDGD